jgi:hypothetical protein
MDRMRSWVKKKLTVIDKLTSPQPTTVEPSETMKQEVLNLLDEDSKTPKEEAGSSMLESVQSDMKRIDTLMQRFNIVRDDGMFQAGPLNKGEEGATTVGNASERGGSELRPNVGGSIMGSINNSESDHRRLPSMDDDSFQLEKLENKAEGTFFDSNMDDFLSNDLAKSDGSPDRLTLELSAKDDELVAYILELLEMINTEDESLN